MSQAITGKMTVCGVNATGVSIELYSGTYKASGFAGVTELGPINYECKTGQLVVAGNIVGECHSEHTRKTTLTCSPWHESTLATAANNIPEPQAGRHYVKILTSNIPSFVGSWNVQSGAQVIPGKGSTDPVTVIIPLSQVESPTVPGTWGMLALHAVTA